MIEISILICSLKERQDHLASLLLNLMNQCKDLEYKCTFTLEGTPEINKYIWDKVEIITCTDNREFTTGFKRNMLYKESVGTYSISADDDDSLPKYYIEELLKAAESNADCFGINGTITTNGTDERKWYISKDNPYRTIEEKGVVTYLRYPNHITAIKSSITKQFEFPNQVFAEDFVWATKIHDSGIIKTEYTIEKPMYHYKYISKK